MQTNHLDICHTDANADYYAVTVTSPDGTEVSTGTARPRDGRQLGETIRAVFGGALSVCPAFVGRATDPREKARDRREARRCLKLRAGVRVQEHFRWARLATPPTRPVHHSVRFLVLFVAPDRTVVKTTGKTWDHAQALAATLRFAFQGGEFIVTRIICSSWRHHDRRVARRLTQIAA